MAEVVCVRCLMAYRGRKVGERCRDASCRFDMPGVEQSCPGVLVPDADVRRLTRLCGMPDSRIEQLVCQVRVSQGLDP